MHRQRPDIEKNGVAQENDRAFREYLEMQADRYGFKNPKRSVWINYMQDFESKESILRRIVECLQFKPPPNAAALDIGCGFGNLLKVLKRVFPNVAGVDIVEERVKWSKKRAPGCDVRVASALSLPFTDCSFDFVIATDVFEHLPFTDQRVAAAEFYRVTKPGGVGFISVPNRFQLKDEHNFVWFGTWLPRFLREPYVRLFSSNDSYTRVWERSPRGWKRLLRMVSLEVLLVAHWRRVVCFPVPPSRCELFLVKPTDTKRIIVESITDVQSEKQS